jgi:shikimate dehydrogenase
MGVDYAEVIGDPIGHSKSPAIHKFWLDALGIGADYRATRVGIRDLPDYFRSRREEPHWRGCNVTMPLKQAVLEWIDDKNEILSRLGAANCVSPGRSGLFGTNFDSEAVLQTLVPYQWEGRAVVVGNGGAARAALWAVALLGFEEIVLMSRDPARARAMAADLGICVRTAELGGAPDCTLLVNATPLGMSGYPPLPVGLAGMPASGAIFEMVYNPLVTPLIQEARARKLKVFDGLEMLIEQASMSFITFFGRGVDTELRLAARQRLAQ